MTGQDDPRVVATGMLASVGFIVAALLTATVPPLPDSPTVAATDRWWIAVGTPAAAMTVVQLAAIGLASWVTLASLVDLVARLRPTRLSLMTRRIICRPALCRLVGGAVLLTSTSPAMIAGADDAEAPDTLATDDLLLVDRGATERGPATEREPILLSDLGSVPGESETDVGEPPSSTLEEPAARDDAWTVQRGDHLWHIARETVLDRGGDPSEKEVAAYWRRLIDANLDVVGDDPDLIHPGQILRLPE